MGCVSSKPPKVDDGIESPMERIPSKRLSRTTSSSREGAPPSVMNRSDSKSSLIDRKTSGPLRVYEERTEKSRVNPVDALANFPVITSIPKARERELVAAGWPSWLASAAGEAVTGWLPRRADTFEKLDKIGEGTYSNVYKARDLLHGKTVALKRVRFDNVDLESIRFMAREILILRRLDHPNVIKLEGLIASTTSSSLYLIFEYMEHDLTGLASLPGVKFSEQQIKCYMQQLLSGLEHCHCHGILHRDIKGSNLLVDDHGILKIADFGLATFYDRHNSVPLTSRVVTLWYRPPELLLGATHYSVSVDLWSAGCILGELYAGKPIMPGRTEVEQLHKIFRLCGSPSEDYWQKSRLPYSTTYKPQKPYERRVAERFLSDVSAPALALIETLLSLDPASRGTATTALESEFFNTKPLPCDPSMLPKYPPSKEIDARRRDQEARRRQALESRRDKAVQGSQVPQESESNLSAKVNAEFVSSLQKKNSQPNVKPRSGLRFNPDESTSGPVYDDPNANSRGSREVSKEIFDRLHKRGVYSGPLTWSNAAERKLKDRPSFSREPPRLSTLSSFGSSRSNSVAQDRHGRVRLLSENKRTGDSLERFPISINDLEGRRDHDWDYYSGNMMDESHKLEEKIRDKKQSMHTYAPENERMHLSGPLLHPSKDLDQMLKEHDRRIQETARRARLEKVRRSKVRAR